MDNASRGIVPWFKNHKSRIVGGIIFGLVLAVPLGFGYLFIGNFLMGGSTLGFFPAMFLGIGSGVGLSVGYTYLAFRWAKKSQ